MVVVWTGRSGVTYAPGRRNSLGHCLRIFVVAMFGESVMGKWKIVLAGCARSCPRCSIDSIVIQGSGHNPAASSVADGPA